MSSEARLASLPAELLLEIFSHSAPKASARTPPMGYLSNKHENYRINISLRNVKAVCKNFAALVTPLITAHYCDGDFYHVRLNGKKMENWGEIKSVIMDGALCDSDEYGHGKETFHGYLRLRDVDAQLGLADVWEKDSGDEVDDEDEEYSVSPLEQENNYERAAVLCLCRNVEEVLFGSDLDDYWKKWSADKDSIAISPIVSAGKGEAFGRAHRFESLRYLSVDVQFMKIGYMLLHEGLFNTDDIEWARKKMLTLPHGEELIKHATCGEERRWNELLSRPVGTPLPFGSLKKVTNMDALSRGWLRDDLSAEELAEKVKEYEPK
ncbi:uncharacterized protein N0V89_006749 [Didymosphaeria variabile]|uniref:F-box domain-containing protein n=1 Tax=Didymosphaeria variabile TaxID=1932322 RepID=A0A9W8XID2_9PLEO|nr:uncharacterized protein N0V89_006749 [Didymosphaeria variabile]KAJ4351407.1 hypothetical protein N0V89_006749 [Didymosphaeria variabile]